MKRVKLFLMMLVLASVAINAQEKLSSDSTQLFFDDNGDLTKIRVKPEHVKDKVISTNPRNDDIIWQRTVLRVVDMREMQNRPLYYPCEDLDAESPQNLYSIILSNVLEGKLPAYRSQVIFEQTYCPPFKPENLLNIEDFLDATNLRYTAGEDTWSRVNTLNPGVVKYYLKVVYYFDKSTSTFHDRILAVGPLYDENYGKVEDLHTSVFFWVPFERLRPFLQEEFVKMNDRNTISEVTFDKFLMDGYYNSYIIKDYDHTQEDIDKGIDDPRVIRQKQERVENAIFDFEQDLWAY